MTKLRQNLPYNSVQRVNISLYPEYTEDTGNMGFVAVENSVSQCSCDPKHHCPICCHLFSGDIGHVGK